MSRGRVELLDFDIGPPEGFGVEPATDDPWRVSWKEIHARAWWYLNHSADVEPSVSRGRPFHGLPRIRLWDDANGFGCDTEPTTLSVFELFTDDDRREPVVREAVWQRSVDLSRVLRGGKESHNSVTFRPTVGVRDAAVSADQLGALLDEVASLRVPVVWFGHPESVTSDVGGRGFEFFSRDQPPAALKLEWSCVTPPEWAPFLDWCARLREFLVRCLSDTGPAEPVAAPDPAHGMGSGSP